MDDQLDVLNERERDFVDDMAWKLRINDPSKKQPRNKDRGCALSVQQTKRHRPRPLAGRRGGAAQFEGSRATRLDYVGL